METQVKTLEQVLVPGETTPVDQWQLRAFQSEQCLSYIAWNTVTREAIVIDPKQEDLAAYRSVSADLHGYLWLGVIDTHTHADHISAASIMTEELRAPLIMHAASASRRVHFRGGRDTFLASHASPVHLLLTPGHTPDSLTVIWGPFLFGGDTLLYGDTGRDDLPGGDPEAHFESLQKIKNAAKPDMIFLAGHDHKSARASSWATQLNVNISLTQSQKNFVHEAAAFDAPAPALLKESLRQNLK